MAACGWSHFHVDSGPVQSCGPVPFAVTAGDYRPPGRCGFFWNSPNQPRRRVSDPWCTSRETCCRSYVSTPLQAFIRQLTAAINCSSMWVRLQNYFSTEDNVCNIVYYALFWENPISIKTSMSDGIFIIKWFLFITMKMWKSKTKTSHRILKCSQRIILRRGGSISPLLISIFLTQNTGDINMLYCSPLAYSILLSPAK